jgi:DNA polymerase-4
MIERRGITLLGVTVSNLDGGAGTGIQLELPVYRGASGALDAAIDELRERFGPDAVVRATLV